MAQQGGPNFGGWFDNTSNYDGVVDKTGQSEVTVKVGTKANGGNFGFGPAAIHVEPGTTVRWKWIGKGGSHNVHANEGATFKSQLYATAGIHFEQVFKEQGIVTYQCDPHVSLGMKGAIVVGGTAAESSGGTGAPLLSF